MKIDNFALTMYQTCPAKFKLRMIEGWSPRRSSAALNAGQVLHRGIEEWYRTGDVTKSVLACRDAWPIEHPVDDWRTLEKVQSTLVEYIREYAAQDKAWNIIGAPDDPMLEVSFTLPTGMYLDCPYCGWRWHAGYEGNTCPNIECRAPLEPIEYGGIFDMAIEQIGQVYVVDHKTTTQMGPSYFNQYKPNNQMSGYIWAAGELSGRRVGGAIINAIGWYRASKTKFARQITTRTADDLRIWKENVRQVANNIARANRTGEYPLNTSACTLYGLCEFHSVHSLGDERTQQRYLEQQYVRENWDHERRGVVASLPVIEDTNG